MSDENQTYQDIDGCPTELAVLKREWVALTVERDTLKTQNAELVKALEDVRKQNVELITALEIWQHTYKETECEFDDCELAFSAAATILAKTGGAK